MMKKIYNTRVLIGLLFIGFILVLRFSGLKEYIDIAQVQESRHALRAFVQEQYPTAVMIYLLWYVFVVTFALPLAALSTVAGGYVFGVFPTVLYANIGATVGGTLFFLFVRYAFGDSVQKHYQDKLAWVNREMDQYGVFYLIAIHFMAVIPLFVVNLLIGLTKTPAWTFIWTTSIGIIPGTLVYAFAGQQLTTIHTVHDIFSFPVLIAFALLAFMSLLPLIAKKYGWFGMR